MEKEKMKKALALISISVRLLKEAEEELGEKFVSSISYKHELGSYVMMPFRNEKEVEEVAGEFKEVKAFDDYKMLTTEFCGMTILTYEERNND